MKDFVEGLLLLLKEGIITPGEIFTYITKYIDKYYGVKIYE